jgi:hypothetical protein
MSPRDPRPTKELQQILESTIAPDTPPGTSKVWMDTSVTPPEFYLVTTVTDDAGAPSMSQDPAVSPTPRPSSKKVYGIKLTELRSV